MWRAVAAFIERDAGNRYPISSWRFWSPLVVETYDEGGTVHKFVIQFWGVIPPFFLSLAGYAIYLLVTR